jgi:hypothetical protein
MIRDIGLSLSPSWRKNLPEIQHVNHTLIKAILRRTGCRIVADSSKIGIRLKYLLKNPEIDVSVIRLIRDGRGVALTYVNPEDFADARNPHLRCGGSGEGRRKTLSMAQGANEWRRSNEEQEAILKRMDPAKWIEIRYESLCTDLSGTMNSVFDFLGVDPLAWNKDFRSVEHHVIGNGMRLDDSSEVVLDERWRKVLDESELASFDQVAGDLNRHFGYQ